MLHFSPFFVIRYEIVATLYINTAIKALSRTLLLYLYIDLIQRVTLSAASKELCVDHMINIEHNSVGAKEIQRMAREATFKLCIFIFW